MLEWPYNVLFGEGYPVGETVKKDKNNQLVRVQPGRIALVCSGLNHVQRGYETFMRDLFDALKEPDPVTGISHVDLLQGSGPEDSMEEAGSSGRRITVPTMTRNGDWMLAIGPKDEYQRYRWEQLSMATGGFLKGIWQRYDLLHVCDPALGGGLLHLRQRFGLPYRLVLHNGGPLTPADCMRFDHIQELTPRYRQMGLDAGVPPERSSLVPIGVWPERFQTVQTRRSVRQIWGLPRDKFIVLSVASLDESYKRLQFLIEAVAGLSDPDVFLLLVGQNQKSPIAQETLALAESKLQGRYRQMTVPYGQIAEMYAACDCFVLCSLQEGFGKVYLEAMAANAPVICHDSPNTQWIVGDMRSRIDMNSQQALQDAMVRFKNAPELGKSVAMTNRMWVDEHFHWKKLRPKYLAMYKHVLEARV